jgi:hypothetical protein
MRPEHSAVPSEGTARVWPKDHERDIVAVVFADAERTTRDQAESDFRAAAGAIMNGGA